MFIQLQLNPAPVSAFIQSLGDGTIPEVTDDDLAGAADAILRLQQTYKLPTSEVVEGYIDGQEAEVLTLEELEHLGLRALGQKSHKLAIEYMKEAYKKAPSDDVETRCRLSFYVSRAHYFVRKDVHMISTHMFIT